jgi:phage protein U
MGVLMMWGPAILETGGTTLDEIREKFGGRWHEHKTIGRMWPGQYLGPRNDRVTVKGVLYPVYQGWDVTQTLAALKAAAKAGVVSYLMSGDGEIFGTFRLDEGERSISNLLPDGRGQKQEYSLEFVEEADPAGPIWSLWP